jgi:biotin-[acetyl-CoA-carboxylase] ligase BirA-like protein
VLARRVLVEALAQPSAATVRMALRGADGHAGRLGDLLEGVAERVLQEHDLCLRWRDVRERVAELASQFGDPGGAVRIVLGRREQIFRQRLMLSRLATLGRVDTRVEDEPVQPGRELRVAPELGQTDAHLRECLLRCVASVLRIAENVARKTLDFRRMARKQRLERLRVAVLRTGDEHRVAELLVRERAFAERLPDLACATHGASLDRVSDLSPETVEPLLRGRLGRPYRFVPECESTQRQLTEDDPEGAVVATDHQTKGRGRLGRVWEDVPGTSILMSVLLRPRVPMPLWPELSVVAGRAVATAIGAGAQVQPPNDVLIGERKVAGLLAEATTGRVVLGIGINVNQRREQLPEGTAKPVTSLYVETGEERNRAALLASVLLEVERGYLGWLNRGNERS